jgi:hypothetical protein
MFIQVYFQGRLAHTLTRSIFMGDLPHTHIGLFSRLTCPHMYILVYFQGRLAHTLIRFIFMGGFFFVFLLNDKVGKLGASRSQGWPEDSSWWQNWSSYFFEIFLTVKVILSSSRSMVTTMILCYYQLNDSSFFFNSCWTSLRIFL